MSSVNGEINVIAEEIKKEINDDVDLSIGSVENPSLAVPVLIERMDKVCSLMNYQSELLTRAETALEEAKYQYKRRELSAKKKYNEAFCRYKQEDRPKPKDQRRTDKEYEAMAELECDIVMNECLSFEREYLNTQHRLEDERHRYEILYNHFLSYRKASDMLMKEMSHLGDPMAKYNKGPF